MAIVRVLTRCKPEPGRKVAALSERLDRRRKRQDSSSGNRTDPWDGHQPARGFVFLGSPGDLAVEDSDLPVELGEHVDH